MPKEKTQTETAAPQAIPEPTAFPMSYDVRIHSFRLNGDTRGTASVTLNGQFGIRGVSIMDEGGALSVKMPGYDHQSGYREHFAATTDEARAEFERAVLTAFDQARAGIKEEQAPAEKLPMQYDVQVQTLYPGAGTVKGTASVTLNGQFEIPKVSIMESSKGLFVSTPGFKGGNGMFKDYCYPITKESRAEFHKAVIDAYQQALTQNQTAGQSTSGRQQPEYHAPQGAPSMTPVMQM